jgi:hypothetical protein
MMNVSPFRQASIGIAAGRASVPSLVGNAPQNLRLYEARGLLAPSRVRAVLASTAITTSSDSVPLAASWRLDLMTGIEMVFELQEANERLRRQIESLESGRYVILRPTLGHAGGSSRRF